MAKKKAESKEDEQNGTIKTEIIYNFCLDFYFHHFLDTIRKKIN